MIRLLTALALVAVASAPSRAQYQPMPAVGPPVPGTIGVTGEGTVSVAPDRALVRLGVTTRAGTAAEALRAHEADMARVLTRVRQFGVADRDIQIEGLSLGENYGPNGPDGFVAQRVVTVTTDSLRAVPDLVAAVVSEGANRLDGLVYTVRDARPAEALALDAAVADARAKAERIAGAAGVTLGRVLAVQELDTVVGYPPMPYGRGAEVEMAVAAEPAAYSAGSNEVRARVAVQFEIVGGR